MKIYGGKCSRYIDWLVEMRPSFSAPRSLIQNQDQETGAAKFYAQGLDTLNEKYERLLEQLYQRLKTAIEVSGAEIDLKVSRTIIYLIIATNLINYFIILVN